MHYVRQGTGRPLLLIHGLGSLEVRKKTFVAIQGEIPSPLHPPSGLSLPSALPLCAEGAGPALQ